MSKLLTEADVSIQLNIPRITLRTMPQLWARACVSAYAERKDSLPARGHRYVYRRTHWHNESPARRPEIPQVEGHEASGEPMNYVHMYPTIAYLLSLPAKDFKKCYPRETEEIRRKLLELQEKGLVATGIYPDHDQTLVWQTSGQRPDASAHAVLALAIDRKSRSYRSHFDA